MTNLEDLLLAYAEDRGKRLVVADWYEENGMLEHAEHWRNDWHPITKDIDLPEILDDYDWQEVFGLGTGGNTTNECEPCPPQATDIDLSPPQLIDIRYVLAAVNGERDEEEWIGVFQLKDGRWLMADAGCDYTGWD